MSFSYTFFSQNYNSLNKQNYYFPPTSKIRETKYVQGKEKEKNDLINVQSYNIPSRDVTGHISRILIGSIQIYGFRNYKVKLK